VIRKNLLLSAILALCATELSAVSARAQQYDSTLFGELRWRMIGPHRGGRTVAAVGIADQPNVFYIGVNNGGVWKTTDYGRVWEPIFDDQPTGSIGALAIAPSNPKVIYVGSGEGLQRPDLSTGDGMYRSSDGGETWTHLGLREGQQIPAIDVDPRNPDRLFVAVLGHPYGPNEERGIYRSTDGGRSFEKVLYTDENTGGMDVAIDPSNPQTVYAVMWAARQAPWEVGSSWTLSDKNGLYKSTDGGSTWKKLTKGLPGAADELGRIGISVSASNPDILFAVVGARKGAGVYRSADSGESWTLVNDDARLWGRDGDFNEVRVDPTDPNVLYVANIMTWKSTDGGKSFSAFRGAPGGDDYHRVWINPRDPRTIILAADQGAIITVNGGETWSSWYNQPTAQLYHVSTDNSFPYWVCGGQQESGSVCIKSRGPYGQITYRQWYPVGVEEYGYVAPDPLDPNIVYGGKVTRFDRRTRQTQNVSPSLTRGGDDFRVVRTQPVLFSPVDPHTLYFASNVLWKTTNGGSSWTKISPDLTRKSSAVPANLGVFTELDPEKGKHRGVIYTIAPSYTNANVIWVGTDDGLIHVTRDAGKSWSDVTPPELSAKPWSKVSMMDASHFDTRTAYAAVNTFRLDDLRPYIYRTHDGGKTWKLITSGLPDGAIVNVVREDPKKRGVLYAGSETQVWVSFDDGERWQSLRLNMPATSIRDLVVHENDLVVGTHGRSFWILDDVSPLRQLGAQMASADAYLFQPATAYRVRWNNYTDTPVPQEEPAGENPPDGAIIDYYLRSAAAGPVTLEILDSRGRVVRRYSSDDEPPPPIEDNVPDYWVRPPATVSTSAGMHRFVWDVHYAPPAALSFSYPISAIYENTPRIPTGAWALPGTYTVELTVNGKSHTRSLTLKMDPNVKTPASALAEQFALAARITDAMRKDYDALQEVRDFRARLDSLRADGGLSSSLDSLDRVAAALEGRGGRFGGGGTPSFASLTGELSSHLRSVDGADARPTRPTSAAVTSAERQLEELLGKWIEVKRRQEAGSREQGRGNR
jgi:photosystem II stability/assembly factor-like uncharacterized protein